MYLKIRILLILLITSLTFYSCGDDPASIGSDALPDDDFINLIEINPDSVQQTSTSVHNNIKMGDAIRVLLGKANNLEAFFLIKFRFSTLPDSLKTQLKNNELNVVSSWIEMRPVYSLGDKTLPYDFTIQKINTEWKEEIDLDEFQNLSIENADVSGTKTFLDSLHSVLINTDLVNSWLMAEADTSKPDEYGVLFKSSDNTARVVGYQAKAPSSTYRFMSLDVVISKKDNSYTDTLSFIPDQDAHLVTRQTPSIPEESLLLRGGDAYNTVLDLMVPKLPLNTTINRALLQVTIDDTKTSVGTPKNDSLVVRFLTSPTDSGIHYDSTTAPVLLKKSGNKYEGDIARFVQRWYNGQNNNGIIISLYNEYISLDQVTLFSSKAANSGDRPKLYITYTSKK